MLLLSILWLVPLALAQSSTPRYQTLPPTPTLPTALTSGYVNTTYNASIWYSTYNAKLPSKYSPILFLHGALANSNWLAYQVSSLIGKVPNPLISIDSRGHGRSIDGYSNITYDLMTNDTIAVLDYLKVPKVTVVGWSDGAILGLDMAMNYTERLERLFSFGGTFSVSNGNTSDSAVGDQYFSRVEKEYKALNPQPNHFDVFENKMIYLITTEPEWGQKAFDMIEKNAAKKKVKRPLIWVVDGDREETVNLDVPRALQSFIPYAGLLILPSVSHFAFIQDNITFNANIGAFLQQSLNQ